MSRVFVGYDSYSVEGVDEEFIRFIFDVALGCTSKRINSEVGLVFAESDRIKKLNSCYRGKDYPTNVLSFANQEMTALGDIESDNSYLGDVYINYSVLVREARDLKISERERFVQLFVHGLLHLLGFHHEADYDAKKMERLEDKIVQLVL